MVFGKAAVVQLLVAQVKRCTLGKRSCTNHAVEGFFAATSPKAHRGTLRAYPSKCQSMHDMYVAVRSQQNTKHKYDNMQKGNLVCVSFGVYTKCVSWPFALRAMRHEQERGQLSRRPEERSLLCISLSFEAPSMRCVLVVRAQWNTKTNTNTGNSPKLILTAV